MSEVAFDNHTNFAVATIAVAPSPPASGLTLEVAPGEGSLFPEDPFNCVLYPPDIQPTEANAEIVRVTNRVGDVFTIERAQEGTTARAAIAGWTIANAITVKVVTDIEEVLEGGMVPALRAPQPTGDVVTDTANLQALVAAINASGGNVDVQLWPGTYAINQALGTITVPNVRLFGHGGVTEIDYSAITSTPVIFYALRVLGTLAAGLALSSDAAIDTATVLMSDTTGLTAGSWVQINSAKVAGTTNQPQGEEIRIASVVPNTSVTFSTPLCDSYKVSDGAQLQLASPVEGFEFVDIEIVGPSDNTLTCAGLGLEIVRDFRISNMRGFKNQYAHIELINCWDGRIHAPHIEVAELTGLAYGIVIGWGCQDITITGGEGRRTRHFVTHGGGTSRRGIPRRIVIADCNIFEALDAGLDAHPSGQHIIFVNCTIVGVGAAGIGGNTDGIVMQASTGIVMGCVVRNVGGVGIHIQPLTVYATQVIVAKCEVTQITSHGIYLNMAGLPAGGSIAAFICEGNDVRSCGLDGSHASIQIGSDTNSGPVPVNYKVSNNSVTAPGNDSIQVRQGGIGSITDNIVEIAQSRNGVRVFGSPGATPTNVKISGNQFNGLGLTGTTAVAVTDGTNCTITDNHGTGCVNGITTGSGTSSFLIAANNMTTCTTPYNIGGTLHLFDVHSNFPRLVPTKTSGAYTLGVVDRTVIFTGGSCTLPNATAVCPDKQWNVVNRGTAAIAVNTTGGQTVGGFASGTTLSPGDSISVVCDGANYQLV